MHDPAAPRPRHYAPPEGHRRIILEVGWDGEAFCGWQSQPKGVSVQDTLWEALKTFDAGAMRPVAAGRTDAGVHAERMPLHVDVSALPLPPERLPLALARRLPPALVLLRAKEAPAGFHARFSCTQRRYRYDILVSAAPHPLVRRALWLPSMPNVEAMNAGGRLLLGKRDFAALATKEDRSTVRELQLVHVTSRPLGFGELLSVEVVGESFLRHMVRAIVGTLLLVGQGKIAPEDLKKILSDGKREAAGLNVPAGGLHFVGANYAGLSLWD